MCWVALDRVRWISPHRSTPTDRVEEWTGTQHEIEEAILSEGWSEQLGVVHAVVRLRRPRRVEPDVGARRVPAGRRSSRVLSTIDATEERLTDERGLVYRYRSNDGLDGDEGSFLLCTFWLSQALATSGQTERARAVFERAIAFVNDVGLLAEEVDPDTGELLGNFPQAFSHIGLVNAAWAISEAEASTAAPPA